MNELYIEANVENIDAVLDFISEYTKDCVPKVRNQIEIAVDEIFSNIARYAYSPEVGFAMVRVAVGDDITIEFEDSGMIYDPFSKEDPELAPTAAERKIGGLGVFLVKNIMDSAEYEHKDGKNVLTIKKSI